MEITFVLISYVSVQRCKKDNLKLLKSVTIASIQAMVLPCHPNTSVVLHGSSTKLEIPSGADCSFVRID